MTKQSRKRSRPSDASLSTVRLHIPALEMDYIKSLIYNETSEFGGVLDIVREDDGRYVGRVNTQSVIKGHEKEFSVVLPPYRRSKHISFHTHPNICYKKLGCVLGSPSIADYTVSFERLVCGEAAHLVCSLEGIYAMRLHETALTLLRDIVRNKSIFPTMENGLEITVSAMRATIETHMRQVQNGRFIAQKISNTIKQQGMNKNAMFVDTTTGLVYPNANILLAQAQTSNRHMIRQYAKGLYRDTIDRINSLTLGVFLDNVLELMKHCLKYPSARIEAFDTMVRTRYGSRLEKAMKESIFHIRLYHRTSPEDVESSISIFSDYSKSLDMSILVDTRGIRKTRAKTMNEEFTARQTPETFLRGNTSPYKTSFTRSRKRQKI